MQQSDPPTQDNLDSSLLSTNSVPAPNDNRFDGLTPTKILAYGVGHFFNDLAGACWFNFLFYYLKRVVETPAATTMIFVGQIVDGIATPTIGYLSDRFTSRYGQRMPWYVGGVLVFLIAFIGLYQDYKSENKAQEYAYYCVVSAFVNIGWAAVQISHMSLVPLLTCSRKRRDRMNNLRNSFTFVANFLALGMGLIVFKLMSDPPLEYKIISYVIAVIGMSACGFFVYHVREVELTRICKQKSDAIKMQIQNQQQQQQQQQQADKIVNNESTQQPQTVETPHSLSQWFKMPQFYLFGICYMGVRLSTNIFGTLLPFYLVGVLKLGVSDQTEQVVPFTTALVPLVVYLSSVAASSMLNKFYVIFGRKMALSVGALLCSISLLVLVFVDESNSWIIYIVSVFVGISQPMILSTGVNFISDVVGGKAKSGAFVFGAYSLLDKFSAGLVIFFIGNSDAYTKKPNQLNQSEIDFIKYTIILIPALSACLGSLIVIGYPIKEYKRNMKEKNEIFQALPQNQRTRQNIQQFVA